MLFRWQEEKIQQIYHRPQVERHLYEQRYYQLIFIKALIFLPNILFIPSVAGDDDRSEHCFAL